MICVKKVFRQWHLWELIPLFCLITLIKTIISPLELRILSLNILLSLTAKQQTAWKWQCWALIGVIIISHFTSLSMPRNLVKAPNFGSDAVPIDFPFIRHLFELDRVSYFTWHAITLLGQISVYEFQITANDQRIAFTR